MTGQQEIPMTVRPQTSPRRRNRPHPTLAILAMAVVVGAAGGCSSHSTPSAARSQPARTTPAQTTPAAATSQPPAGGDASACTLVTADAVSTAVGEPMTQTGGEASDCAYANADQSQQLLVHEFPDQTNMNNLIQQLESSSEHVPGLGDDAFWNGTIDVMFVRKGDRGFTISSASLGAKTPSDPDAPKLAMVQLATAALANF